MAIIIRNEEEKDYKKVEELAREAFWNLYFPGCFEHYNIHKMRNHKDFIRELSFVIELDGEIIGGIFYTKSKIISENGLEYETISFGPVFILPKYHRQGYGRKLITHSIEVAKEMGYRGILTLGYPYHYETYGFLGGKKYNISMADGKYYKGLLALPLYEGVFSEALDATLEEVEEFDKSFPFKEKKIQESQKEFEKACNTLDD